MINVGIQIDLRWDSKDRFFIDIPETNISFEHRPFAPKGNSSSNYRFLRAMLVAGSLKFQKEYEPQNSTR